MDETDSVFLSVELIGPDGETTGGQPMALPENVHIINDIDSIEVLRATSQVGGGGRFRRFSIQDRRRHNSGPSSTRGARTRHASAPDPSRKNGRSRNSSGQQ